MKLENILQIGAWLLDADGDGLPDTCDVSIIIGDGWGEEVYHCLNLLAARLGTELMGATLPLCFADSGPSPTTTYRVIVGHSNMYWPSSVALPPAQTGQGLALLHGNDLLLDGNDEELANILYYLATTCPQVAESNTLEQVLQDRTDAHALTYDGQEPIIHVQPRDEIRFTSALPAGLSPSRRDTPLSCHRHDMSYPTALRSNAIGLCLQSFPPLHCLSEIYTLSGLYGDNDGDYLPDHPRYPVAVAGSSLQERVAIANLYARVGLESLGFIYPRLQSSSQPFFSTRVTAEPNGFITLTPQGVTVSGTDQSRSQVWGYLATSYPHSPLGPTWTELAIELEAKARQQNFDHYAWHHTELPWEVEAVRGKWQDICRGSKDLLAAEVRVSEPLSVRQQLQQELTTVALAAGHGRVSLTVRSAYKQGLYWVKEELIPMLLEISPRVDRCIIEFAPFTAPDAFDPTPRWLLELYPVDELLAKALGLVTECISFVMNDKLETTYSFTAYAEGVAVLSAAFTAWHSCKPYLPMLGPTPTVHPPTGGITWSTAEGEHHLPIATDAERVFAFYEQELLPKLLGSAENYGFSQEQQPFFEQLEIKASLSEPEELLGVREEMVSVADALHEDIHFVGLDLFKRVGEGRGQTLRSPGLILPFMRVAVGDKPTVAYRLIPRQERQSLTRPRWVALEIMDNQVTSASLEWQVLSQSEAQRLCTLFGSTVTIDSLSAPHNASTLRVNANYLYPGGSLAHTFNLQSSSSVVGAQNFVPNPVYVPPNHVYYDEHCLSHLRQLAHRPGVTVSLAGTSRLGRKIYGVSVTSPGGGAIQSATKYAGRKPTYMHNNRHHANEVSSTGAILELLEELTSHDTNLTTLLQYINVAAIPLENADGAALHQELARHNPLHKFHAARFNSVGREFADGYFKNDSTAPESKVLPDMWRTWVPDIIADNHGIPSHEWEQPFSGYLCPWFASFWIPRSLFYGYFWYVDQTGHPSLTAAQQLERVVGTALKQDTAISARNADLLRAWNKYFVPYLTDHHAGVERNGTMWYYVPYQVNPTSRFASHRYPHLTILDWTTEVADETAQGEYLGLCVRTHKLAQQAGLQWLAQQPVELVTTLRGDHSVLYRATARKRPLTPQRSV